VTSKKANSEDTNSMQLICRIKNIEEKMHLVNNLFEYFDMQSITFSDGLNTIDEIV
jgi:hypothetical protein